MKRSLDTLASTAIMLGFALAPLASAAERLEVSPPEQPATTTFHFVQMPVRSALGLIAEEGRFNLVVSDAVQGTVSLHLDHATWRQALDVVLRLKGLSARRDSSTLWVDSAVGG